MTTDDHILDVGLTRHLHDSVIDRTLALLQREQTVILGLVGAPGAGKSTLAEAIVAAVSARELRAVWLPMDGFHLADAELTRLGRLQRKGAADTFDAAGYLATLHRVRTQTEGTIYVPAFDRAIEQPIAGSVPVPADARLVVTEGNYLLQPEAPWNHVTDITTEIWYCDIDDTLRRTRLHDRHVQYGKTPAAATAWIDDVDEPNALHIAATRSRADAIVRYDTDGLWRIDRYLKTDLR